MNKFSDRLGITKPKIDIQIKTIDPDLRSCLWNVFTMLLKQAAPTWANNRSSEMDVFIVRLWHSFFKEPLDLIPSGYTATCQKIRFYFFSTATWYDVYNFLEFASNNYPDLATVENFINECNFVLERELSGYRFIGKQIVPMTSPEEVHEVEEAMTSTLTTVNLHLENAVKLMSHKTDPDYRNSIKESISAVEAICKLLANNQKTTLGYALDIIEKEGKITLHESLKKAFQNLYTYTSDADGIRHALKEETVKLDFEEAKFMLVACSAFVNYLKVKASKAKLIDH